MSKVSKLFIAIILLLASINKSYCQNLYVRLNSDTAKASHICTVYLGCRNLKTRIREASINIPFAGFYPFECDATDSLYLSVDCIPNGFVIDKPFSCGDSIIINVDKRTFRCLNKR
jgi:hypothetical protein